jgi:O-antigen ligase
MKAALLLATLAWTTAAGGGDGPGGMGVTAVLLLAAVLHRPRPRVRWAPAVATSLLVAWMLAVVLAHGDVSAASLHVPLLVALVALAVAAASSLDPAGRRTLAAGVVALGTLHAGIVLASAIGAGVRGESVLPPGTRAESLLGSANALAFLLLASSILTAGFAVGSQARSRTRLVLVAALTAQAGALLLTGCRAALLVALLVAGVATRRRLGTWGTGALGAFAVLAVGVVGQRFRGEGGGTRVELWAEAMDRIAQHPVAGWGPLPPAYQATDGAGRATTHAHNELLQLTVEFGLVGLLLMVIALALAARQVDGRVEPVLLVASLSLVASGMTDFSLRVPAIVLAASVLFAAAVTRRAADARGTPGALSRRVSIG